MPEIEVWTLGAGNVWTKVVSRSGDRAFLGSVDAHLDVQELYAAAAEPPAAAPAT